mgnify:CR=1 FL=1
MMDDLLPTKPMRQPTIFSVRDLTEDDVLALPVAHSHPHITRLRESHHRIARLIATGLRTNEIADLTGYTNQRINTLRYSPAMKELIASYMSDIDGTWREEISDYYSNISKARDILGRQILDRVESSEDDPDKEIPLGLAFRLHGDLADRTGYGKRQTQVNIHADFAALLEQRIKRSQEAKLIEAKPISEAAE